MPRLTKKPIASSAANSLTVRLDEESKRCLEKAAGVRRLSVSDYILAVAVPQARRESKAAREKTVSLTPEEQLSFWKALNESPKLTAAQRRLGAVVRGEE